MSKKWSETDLADLFARWKAGEEIEDLCKRFARTPAAIRQQVSHAGVQRTAEKLTEVRRAARYSR